MVDTHLVLMKLVFSDTFSICIEEAWNLRVFGATTGLLDHFDQA
jgi:hypothetical protein